MMLEVLADGDTAGVASCPQAWAGATKATKVRRVRCIAALLYESGGVGEFPAVSMPQTVRPSRIPGKAITGGDSRARCTIVTPIRKLT
jgi:hypothetical protein